MGELSQAELLAVLRALAGAYNESDRTLRRTARRKLEALLVVPRWSLPDRLRRH